MRSPSAMPPSFAATNRHRKCDDVKYFLIKYTFSQGSPEEWHREIARFIAALDGDPALSGKISYRCLKHKQGSDYYHLAAAADEQTVATLGQRDFFTHYTERSDFVSGGTVEVLPLELIAETAFRA
jgi:hypothetical protein